MHLLTSIAIPLENTRVCLEPRVVLAEFILKFKKKNHHFQPIFGVNSLKTIRASHTAVGQDPAASPVAQSMS